MNVRLAAAILIAAWFGAAPSAQPRGQASLLVLSKGDQTLAVVDPQTLRVLGRVPSGPDPHEVVASTDGRAAYISNYNGGGNIITPVDLIAMKALPPIDLGQLRAPHGLAFAGGKLWFSAEGAKAIGTYDPATGKVERVLETGQNGTHMVVVSDDVRRLVSTNMGSGNVTIAEQPGGRGDWNQTLVTVGPRGEGFDVSPNGKEAWVANAGDGTVSIVDLSAKKVTETLQANVNGANRLKFTPDGRLVLISTLTGSDLTILDAAARKVAKRLNIGRAAGIQVQPDGARAYVACTPDNYVAIIDLKTLESGGRIDAGRQPDGLAWAVRR
jgi:DNA-binding beta-propeller fold protein YncE